MILHTENKQKGILFIMTTFTLDGKLKTVDEEKIMNLTNQWLSTDLDANTKSSFADSVRFLIADIELDNPFSNCKDFSIESYYFLACLLYAFHKHNYQAIITCEDDLEILDFLNYVTKEIYDKFIETTDNDSMTADEFLSWYTQL